jgi:hypothetical protein
MDQTQEWEYYVPQLNTIGTYYSINHSATASKDIEHVFAVGVHGFDDAFNEIGASSIREPCPILGIRN